MYHLATCFWVSDCTHSTGFVGCAEIVFMLKTLKQQIFAQKVYLCYAMQYHCNRKDCRKLHIITFLSRISPEFHQKEKESHEIFVTL